MNATGDFPLIWLLPIKRQFLMCQRGVASSTGRTRGIIHCSPEERNASCAEEGVASRWSSGGVSQFLFTIGGKVRFNRIKDVAMLMSFFLESMSARSTEVQNPLSIAKWQWHLVRTQ